jgi:hypothetical protein
MWFAIGVPGGPVRVYLMSDLEDAQRQCGPGEVAVACDVQRVGATITADGATVIPVEMSDAQPDA